MVTDFSAAFGPAEPYPYEETHNLREGPDLHPSLLPLLPYIGLWRGKGQGGYPTVPDFPFAQEARFSHDGRPFLFYESRTWVIDADEKPVRPAARETGWWRPVEGSQTDVELLLCHPTGVMELYLGAVDGTKIELSTDAVLRTSTAKEVTAGQRLYGIVDGALMYAAEMAAEGQGMQPHLSARLERVGG